MGHEPEVRHVTVADAPLACPVCKNDTFWTRRTLMNTAGVTFLGFDWANREARNEVCGRCGYVFWFLV